MQVGQESVEVVPRRRGHARKWLMNAGQINVDALYYQPHDAFITRSC